MPRQPPRPSGPAGQVAGTAPVEALRGPAGRMPAHAKLPPRSGPTGSSWPGNFYLPPATTTGKVFFTTTGNGQTENWVCSASTVNSNGRDAVLTAGHCVYGSLGGEVPGERWHSNWVFVPDYYYGYAPYGVWTARQLWTLTNYINNQDEGDDIGAAVMNTNSSGQHIVSVVGGQGLAWNWAENQYVYDFGYPAAPPFNGASLQYCNGSEFNWPYVSSTMGLAATSPADPAAARGCGRSAGSGDTSTGSMTSVTRPFPVTSSPPTSATTPTPSTTRSPTCSDPAERGAVPPAPPPAALTAQSRARVAPAARPAAVPSATAIAE